MRSADAVERSIRRLYYFLVFDDEQPPDKDGRRRFTLYWSAADGGPRAQGFFMRPPLDGAPYPGKTKRVSWRTVKYLKEAPATPDEKTRMLTWK